MAWASQRRSTASTVAAGMTRVVSRIKDRAMTVMTTTSRNSPAIQPMRQTRPKQHAAAARPMITPHAVSFGISISR